MSKKDKKPTSLTLHQLLPALSYWGATVRLLLIAVVAVVVLLVRSSELESNGLSAVQAFLTAGQAFVYSLGSFLILEVGYLAIARSYPVRRHIDQAILLGSEGALALGYFLPYFVLVPAWFVTASRFIFVAVLFVLGLRLLIGLLYSKKV
jgi:hypothetical protein